MQVTDHVMVNAWSKVLELSKVTPGQKVTILTSSDTHPQTLRTAIAASLNQGAIVNRIDLQPVNGEKSLSPDKLAYVGTTPLTGNTVAMAALMESDVILDLMLLLFSPEQHEILLAGKKILLAVEPPEILARLVPTKEDRDRVNAAGDMLQKAKQMHVSSEAGTDLVCSLGDYPLL